LVDLTSIIQLVIGFKPWEEPIIRSFTSCSQPSSSQFSQTDFMNRVQPTVLTAAWFRQYHVCTCPSCSGNFGNPFSGLTSLKEKYEYTLFLKSKRRSGVSLPGVSTGGFHCLLMYTTEDKHRRRVVIADCEDIFKFLL
jgi:hypothetical protein